MRETLKQDPIWPDCCLLKIIQILYNILNGEILTQSLMNSVLDVVIVLFWSTFFLATVLGVINEYRKHEENYSEEQSLDDDDPVFLMQGQMEK